ATAEDDGVDRAHQVTRVEIVQAHHVVGAAAQLHSGYGRPVTQHDGDAREPDGVGGVTDANTGDVGDHARAIRPDPAVGDADVGVWRVGPGLRLTSAALTRPSATSPASSRARRAMARASGWRRRSRARSAKPAAALVARRAGSGRPVASKIHAISRRRYAQRVRTSGGNPRSSARARMASSRSLLI